jgi:hypothetical protein
MKFNLELAALHDVLVFTTVAAAVKASCAWAGLLSACSTATPSFMGALKPALVQYLLVNSHVCALLPLATASQAIQRAVDEGAPLYHTSRAGRVGSLMSWASASAAANPNAHAGQATFDMAERLAPILP